MRLQYGILTDKTKVKKPETGESRAVRFIKHAVAMSMRLQYGILIDKTK